MKTTTTNTKTLNPRDPAILSTPHPPQESLAAIGGSFDKATLAWIAPPTEVKRLSGLQTKIVNLHEFDSRLNYDAARKAYAAQAEQHISDIASGKAQALEASDSFSMEDYLEDFAEKRRAVRDQIRKISSEAWEIAKPMRERWASAAADLASEIESGEKETAARFCLPHKPSHVVMAIRKAGANMIDSIYDPAPGTSPAAMLPFLKL